MPDDHVQPGAEVPRDTYERFKQFVEERHGKLRGNLGTELDRAMQNHMSAARGPDRLARIEDDVAAVRAMLAEGEGDGGTDLSLAESTHTRAPTEPPNARAPQGAKAAWVAARVEQGQEGISVEADVAGEIRDEWGFRDDTVESLTERVVDRLDRVPHPRNADVLVTEERREELVEREREKEREKARETLDKNDDAEPA